MQGPNKNRAQGRNQMSIQKCRMTLGFTVATFTCTTFVLIRLNSFQLMNLNVVFSWL